MDFYILPKNVLVLMEAFRLEGRGRLLKREISDRINELLGTQKPMAAHEVVLRAGIDEGYVVKIDCHLPSLWTLTDKGQALLAFMDRGNG